MYRLAQSHIDTEAAPRQPCKRHLYPSNRIIVQLSIFTASHNHLNSAWFKITMVPSRKDVCFIRVNVIMMILQFTKFLTDSHFLESHSNEWAMGA